jgi:hypothetical protein
MTTAASPTAPPDLNGRHRHTYDALFRHPAAHNLEWHDVRSLLDAMCEVVAEHNGHIQARRNGELLTVHAPKHKDVATVEDLMAIRHFLEKSAAPAPPPPVVPGADLLVVIDHRGAEVYRTEVHGAVPQRLVPYDPHGFRKHLHSEANVETGGRREPERKSFYEAVAKTLRGAERVLVFGSGTGRSSAMEQLLADLRAHHRDVAERVIGAVVVDAHHTTENQLLAHAREFYAAYGARAAANSVVAAFAAHEPAEEALRTLLAAGFDMTKLSIVGTTYHTDEQVAGYYTSGKRVLYWGAPGAFWSASWSLLSGSGYFRIPGVGRLLVAGPLVAEIVGALNPAAGTGGLSALGAALAAVGVPRAEVVRYEAEVRSGKLLLLARGTLDEIRRAADLLKTTRATTTALHGGPGAVGA